MARTQLPEIRINYASLLYSVSEVLMKNHGQKEKYNYQYYLDRTDEYRKSWQKYEKNILTSLCKALDLSFHLPVIDVSLAPYFVPISSPLIISFYYDTDEFIDALTHELIHILLTDNNKLSVNNPETKDDLAVEWKKMFGKQHSWNTVVHIPVHAVHKYIYLDVLKAPERLERDKKTVKGFEGSAKEYTKSWSYVDRNDYNKIIELLKNFYAKL